MLAERWGGMTPWDILQRLSAEQIDVALAHYRVRARRREESASMDSAALEARMRRLRGATGG